MINPKKDGWYLAHDMEWERVLFKNGRWISQSKTKHTGPHTEILIRDDITEQSHIEYNKENRFGQSLFIDDVCVYHSFYHSDDDIKEFLEMSKNIEMPEHKIPYN
jgi:hypothetical protein